MANDTMKSWQYSIFSGKLEDHLTITEAPIPAHSSLTGDQLLVQVISAAINPLDYKLAESGLMGRLVIPRPATPGLDFCGRVIAKHPSNTAFETGQLVFGGFNNPGKNGTLAQYTVIPGACCSPLPSGVDPDQAAAVGTAATSAYQSLTPKSLKPGSKIFINGGSGGVGTWSVQFAKILGADVVTTCSPENVDMCKQLGADEVLDYKKTNVIKDLKKRGKVFDLIVDNVGSSADLYSASGSILKPHGAYYQVGVGSQLTMGTMAATVKRQVLPKIFGGHRYNFLTMNNSSEFLRPIGDWMAEGKAKAIIDSTFSFEEVPDAFRKLKEGHTKGKIVIHVSQSPEE
ncbi:unnamed protein product [Clonostachys rhizophaga]|uniref:Enoyl reductase (ER) domain-containing protein n=1 Tax=Clonostachys rhizophaga TaxID=160324 RepID=A0A9N9Y9R4_9HYPO|nr:unnamed protein product [Clonostachys rhizophaga]